MPAAAAAIASGTNIQTHSALGRETCRRTTSWDVSISHNVARGGETGRFVLGPKTYESSGAFAGAIGAIALDLLRHRHAVALRVVDAQALQHADDVLVLGELGDGALGGEVADLVDRT